MTIDGVNNKPGITKTESSESQLETGKQAANTGSSLSGNEKTQKPVSEAVISKTSSSGAFRQPTAEKEDTIRNEQTAFYEASALAENIRTSAKSGDPQPEAAHNNVSPESVHRLVTTR